MTKISKLEIAISAYADAEEKFDMYRQANESVKSAVQDLNSNELKEFVYIIGQ